MQQEIQSMHNDFPFLVAGLMAYVPFPLGRFNAIGRAMNARNRLVCTMEAITTRFRETAGGSGNLLENLRRMGKTLSYGELLNTLITFALAGFDTVAITVSALIVVLFSEPENRHLVKLRNKVNEHIKPGELVVDELKNLPRMNAVLNEALRFRAPAIGGIRLACEDLPLKDGTIVPKGASFMSYFAATNFNKEYWGANTDEFDPERFLYLKDGGENYKHNLMSFGRGAHTCHGEHFARLELHVFLVRVAQSMLSRSRTNAKWGYQHV